MEKVILGLPWLCLRNPHIDWQKGKMRLASTEQSNSEEIEVDIHKIAANRLERHSLVADGTLEQTSEEIFCITGFTYSINAVNLSTQIAIDKIAGKAKKMFEEMVPSYYRDYKKVFSEKESQRLPEHQPWDHAIDLIPDAKTHWKVRTYPLSPTEQEELNKFLKEHLTKGYLMPSKSPMACPVFFIKKKDSKLCLVQDYKQLNNITVKNRYPLPLVVDIINRLKGAQYFTKFDVRWGYHNIRIHEGDEWKGAMSTNRGLFEPKVMYFGMTNSPATFQALMNSVFADLITKGEIAVYMDDILIYTEDLKHHRKIVREVLAQLLKYDLYLKPEKCDFEKQEMEYLGMIITPGEVCMDPGKVNAVRNWPTPKTLKDVRGFIGFSNF